MFGIIAAVVGAATQIYTANKAAKQQKNAAEAQRKQNRVNQKISDIQAQRSRRQRVSQAQTAAARQTSGAFAGGAQGSSALAGSLSANASSAAGDVGFSNTIAGLSEQGSIFGQQAADAQSKANEWNAWGNMAGQVSSIFSGAKF